jgi:hypothetical protein
MDLSKVAKVFNDRGFKARTFENINQVNDIILKEVGPDLAVGVGGSVTVKSSGITDLLRQRGNRVFFHWEVPKAEAEQTRRAAFGADVYLASSNAVTMDGKLVNVDANGNRVAGMFYGPRRVYIICGKNKIVEDEEKAVDRIKTVACPKNAERLNINTPCRKTGNCHDCRVRDRMCRVKVVMEYCPPGKEINLMFVDQELGY